NEWQNTAAVLALEAEPLGPSALLRDRILASIRVESRSEPLRIESVKALSADVRQPDSRVVAFPKRDVWASLRSFGAIAAALILVALIVSLFLVWQQNRRLQNEFARLSRESQQTQAQLDHERAVVKLITSPDSHMAKLAGTTVAPGAHAMLAYDKEGHVMLMARGLPSAPKGMAYQLWYIKDNQKM